MRAKARPTPRTPTSSLRPPASGPICRHRLSTDLVRTLGVLTGHRADLVADRVRMINRLRDLLTSVFPALEREFDFASCKERWCS